MRYAILGFCVFATACAGAPTSPSSVSSGIATSSPSSFSAQVVPTFTPSVGAGVALTKAKGVSGTPFKGRLQATETVDGNLHHLVGTGNGTHLGRFTYTAEITVDNSTGVGVGSVTWTAANGDQIFASTVGAIVDISENGVTLRETQTITGGTGRFSEASGTVTVDRTLDFSTGTTTGSFGGTISLGH